MDRIAKLTAGLIVGIAIAEALHWLIKGGFPHVAVMAAFVLGVYVSVLSAKRPRVRSTPGPKGCDAA